MASLELYETQIFILQKTILPSPTERFVAKKNEASASAPQYNPSICAPELCTILNQQYIFPADDYQFNKSIG